MNITLEEIAEGLQSMKIDDARKRVNLFKREGLLSDFQYVKLLHLVNGGDPEVMKTWESGKSTPDKPNKEKELSWLTRLKNWADS